MVDVRWIAMVWLCTGCSLMFVRGPAPTSEIHPVFPTCTSSLTWPIVDGVIGGILAASAVGAARDWATDDDSQRGRAAVLGAAFAVAAGASALIGFGRVSRCNAARSEFVRRYPPTTPIRW